MNLKTVLSVIKTKLGLTDVEFAKYLDISTTQLARLKKGHWESLGAAFLVRVSKYSQVSIDELLDHKMVPAGYQFPEGQFSMQIDAPENYLQYYIKKGDALYVAPFVAEDSKIDDLVVLERDQKLVLEPYTGLDGQGQILFHVIGSVRKNMKISKTDQNKIVYVSMGSKTQKKTQETETPAQAEGK